MAKQLKITQIRSQIGRLSSQKKTLVALGLGRISKTAKHEASSSILGMINKVSHLVSVEELK